MAIKKGDLIVVDYTGKLDSGEVFDTSNHGGHSHPLIFHAGQEEMIPGFDNAVIGMNKNDSKTIKIESKEAYGEVRPELMREVPREMLPKEQEPQVGMMLMMGTPDGRQFPVRIAKVEKDKVTLDMNHPLAGKNLTFEIKIVGIGEEDAKKFETESHEHHH
ncbi:MAG: peptidylprolyl isomerase [Nanoarchaeota archaeon]